MPEPRPVPGRVRTILNISNSLGPLAAPQRRLPRSPLRVSIISPIAWRLGARTERTHAGAARGTPPGSDLCARA